MKWSASPQQANQSVLVPIDELYQLAQEKETAGRLDEAESLLRHIIAGAPTKAEALHLLAVVAYKKRRVSEALALMQSAITHGIDTPLYQRNICELYRTLGRYDEAEAAARQGVALNPANPIALLNLGIVLADRQKNSESIAYFERALALDPTMAGAHFGLAETLLAIGEFERGWKEYIWRFKMQDATPPVPKTDRPQWDGAPLADGTLLLVADQGFGDAIQFSRYIPWVAARCPDIALACSPELKPILRQLHPAMRLFTEWRDRGTFSAWCALSDLPMLAGTRLDSIPSQTPYLHADPDRRARWARRLAELSPPGLRRVGLVWAGRASHKNDHKRSTTLQSLAELGTADGNAFFVLQKGPAQRQVSTYYGRAPLIHLSTEIASFEDTMAILAELDLLVSVDTSVAHLAGAMGRPVWIMLPWSAEWRWLQDRTDSPWYPTAKLFRQSQPGGWKIVAERIAEGLRCKQSVIISAVNMVIN